MGYKAALRYYNGIQTKTLKEYVYSFIMKPDNPSLKYVESSLYSRESFYCTGICACIQVTAVRIVFLCANLSHEFDTREK